MDIKVHCFDVYNFYVELIYRKFKIFSFKKERVSLKIKNIRMINDVYFAAKRN